MSLGIPFYRTSDRVLTFLDKFPVWRLSAQRRVEPLKPEPGTAGKRANATIRIGRVASVKNLRVLPVGDQTGVSLEAS